MPIIPLSEAGLQESTDWQWHLRHAVRSTDELGRLLGLSLDHVPTTGFPLLVPRPYLSRMAYGDPNDPLLLQVLPRREEQDEAPGYVTDPLDELRFTGSAKGLVQKYQGRVLVIATGSCAVNCRYCFRRHFPYSEQQAGTSDWEAVLQAVSADATLTEVILSGGDPLVLSDRKLRDIITALDGIAHVDTIRFHTRVPVVIPQRITGELLQLAGSTRSRIVFVTHINHGNEIDDHLRQALQELRATGITLLNQSVLLRGVNDSAAALTHLSRQLFAAGVLPYYLHLLDPVSGARHFDVEENPGRHLIRTISSELPGYLVPRLVREVPGEAAKHAIPVN